MQKYGYAVRCVCVVDRVRWLRLFWYVSSMGRVFVVFNKTSGALPSLLFDLFPFSNLVNNNLD